MIFEHYDYPYMIFKKLGNVLLFSLIIYPFFSKYYRTGVFNKSEIGNEHATNFQNKMYVKFQKIEKQKKFRFGGLKNL